jgi:hypothetical protein
MTSADTIKGKAILRDPRVSIHGCWSVLQTLKGWGLV